MSPSSRPSTTSSPIEVAHVAVAARRDELEQPAPRLARRRAEQRDAVAHERMHGALLGGDLLEAQHLAADEDGHAVDELDRAVGLAEHAVERVERRDRDAAVGRALEPRVLVREEAILVERDVAAGAADQRVLGGEREALAVGAVAIDEHGRAPRRAARDARARRAQAAMPRRCAAATVSTPRRRERGAVRVDRRAGHRRRRDRLRRRRARRSDPAAASRIRRRDRLDVKAALLAVREAERRLRCRSADTRSCCPGRALRGSARAPESAATGIGGGPADGNTLGVCGSVLSTPALHRGGIIGAPIAGERRRPALGRARSRSSGRTSCREGSRHDTTGR